MGGAWWSTAPRAQGSTFHFTLPLGVGPDRREQAIACARRPDLRGMPVLVVDDNATNRALLAGMLRQWADAAHRR